MLLTTIAGSLPKPSWLAKPRVLWAPWNLSGPALAEGKRDAVLVALKEQEAAGIDIVTDGEQSRQHFVHGFLEAIDGIDFARRVTIGIRADRYKAEVPTVTGPLGAPRAVHADGGRFARAHTTTAPQVHHARADDDRGHARRRALSRPAAPGHGVRADPQRGGARARGARPRRAPARRAGLQRVHGRRAGAGASRRCIGPSRGWPARPPCTSATATGSRPTSTGRRRSAASGGSTSRRSRRSPRAASTRSRSSAPTRACPSRSSAS